MLRTAVRRNLLRFNSSAAAAPKSFQKTAATLPNSTNDFVLTKLVHGSTDLSIAITARARDKLYSIANGDKNPETALKIGVESGGCHGFQYNLDLSELSKELEKQADALVFKRSDGDAGEYGVAQLVMDEASLEILQDSKIDYTKELIGSQFKVVDSPYTSTECGCGSSFDFDFDKLEKKKAEKGQ
ncbi:iron-sulfur assembly protein 2 [Diutina catenulata]